jgi:hypothetical protein
MSIECIRDSMLYKGNECKIQQSHAELKSIPVEKMQEMTFLYNALQDGWKIYKHPKTGQYIFSGPKTRENVSNTHFKKKIHTYIRVDQRK